MEARNSKSCANAGIKQSLATVTCSPLSLVAMAIMTVSAGISLFSTTFVPLDSAQADIRAGYRIDSPLNQCAQVIKECLGQGEAQHTECLFESALDVQCEGSELGGLAFRRWSHAPQQEVSDAAGKEPGTEAFDAACLSKFDTEWAQRLRSQGLSRSDISQLTVMLEACRAPIQNPELLRP